MCTHVSDPRIKGSVSFKNLLVFLLEKFNSKACQCSHLTTGSNGDVLLLYTLLCPALLLS